MVTPLPGFPEFFSMDNNQAFNINILFLLYLTWGLNMTPMTIPVSSMFSQIVSATFSNWSACAWAERNGKGGCSLAPTIILYKLAFNSPLRDVPPPLMYSCFPLLESQKILSYQNQLTSQVCRIFWVQFRNTHTHRKNQKTKTYSKGK